MSKNYKRKIVLEFDYGQVKEGVTTVSAQMGILNKEYRASQAEARAFGSTTDQLANRQKYLQERIKIINGTLEEHKKRLEEAKSNENAKSVERYTKEVSYAQAELKQLNADLVVVGKELDKQKEILGKTSDEWKDFSDKTGKLGSDLTRKLTLPIAALGAASFKLGADYEQALGKMEVVFERNTGAMQAWASNSLETMNLSKLSATQIASDFGALFKGMGMSIDKTSEWSMTLTERVMDLSNFYDTTVDETVNALNAIVTGQTQPLRKFGINMTEATLQEYAFANGIKKKVSEMTEAEKVQLRYNFVMDRTAIAVGTTARESDSATAQLNKLKEISMELGISFAEVIIPAILPFIEVLNTVLKWLAGLDDGTKKFIGTIGFLLFAVGPVLNIISKVTGLMGNLSSGANLVNKGVGLASKGIDAMGFTMSATTAKILLVVAAVTALAIALAVLFGKSRDVERAFGSIGNTTNQLTGNINRNAQAVSNTRVQGTHALGIAAVPYDGYVARLHKDEAVIPAKDNPYRGGSLGGGDTIIIHANVKDYRTLEQIIKDAKEKRQRNRSGGEVYA